MPSPAATLILVRARGFLPEILLLKRSAQARFMPNAYVFAGGAVDPADATEEVYDVCARLGDNQASERLALTANGLRFFVAAIREAFEECGLLLAYDQAGRVVDLAGWDEARLRLLRAQVCAGQPGFAAICKLNGWRLAVDGLVYFDHWITPANLKRRFDTRFFVARAPARQNACLAGDEMSDLVWHSAAEALAGHASGELLLMQATRAILGEIARFDHIDALFAFAQSGRKILPTTPVSGTAQGTPAG
jgi:8-oxo-dGTP pyrophosphatase MutT (NUDIX family)